MFLDLLSKMEIVLMFFERFVPLLLLVQIVTSVSKCLMLRLHVWNENCFLLFLGPKNRLGRALPTLSELPE